jgi:hypothetical protein
VAKTGGSTRTIFRGIFLEIALKIAELAKLSRTLYEGFPLASATSPEAITRTAIPAEQFCLDEGDSVILILQSDLLGKLYYGEFLFPSFGSKKIRTPECKKNQKSSPNSSILTNCSTTAGP